MEHRKNINAAVTHDIEENVAPKSGSENNISAAGAHDSESNVALKSRSEKISVRRGHAVSKRTSP